MKTDHRASNRWFRNILHPKELSQSVFFMYDEIWRNKELFNETVRYIEWWYENAGEHYMTGLTELI